MSVDELIIKQEQVLLLSLSSFILTFSFSMKLCFYVLYFFTGQNSMKCSSEVTIKATIDQRIECRIDVSIYIYIYINWMRCEGSGGRKKQKEIKNNWKMRLRK